LPDRGGRGEVENTEGLTVTIPVGVEDGIALRVAGRGMASPRPGSCRAILCGGPCAAGPALPARRRRPLPRARRPNASASDSITFCC